MVCLTITADGLRLGVVRDYSASLHEGFAIAGFPPINVHKELKRATTLRIPPKPLLAILYIICRALFKISFL
jgi:hypothetical protein